MKKKKNSISTIDLYDKNLERLMNISKFIDEDNDYPPETQNSCIFIKLLFQDIRKCSKWYANDEWRPIKTAIHNCYKLLQNGYVPENQGELENNIKILEKLLKDPSSKKSNVDKISEEVVQNIFDKTLKNLNNDNNNNINNINNNKINELNNINIINNKVYKEDDNENNFLNIKKNNFINNKSEFVTKENMENALNEQKKFYENKMISMQNEINDLKNKINNLTDLVENIGKCFIKSINKENKNNQEKNNI